MLIVSERIAGGQSYPRIVKHFGVAKTEQEASNLKILAQEYLDFIGENNDVISKIDPTQNLLFGTEQALDVLFYDLTTIYFEVNNQDELRDFGFSKDGKHHHVQIVLAVIVTHGGLPISYEIFQGNTYEGHTLIPTILELKKKYNITRIILVADSGLINKENIASLNEANWEYIIGARLKNSSKQILKAAFAEEGYINLNDDLKSKIYNLTKKNIITKDKLVIYYSAKRAKKDAYDRTLAVEKIKKHIGSSAKNKLAGSLRKPYVTLTEASHIDLDEEKLAATSKFDGYFAIQTNIKDCNPQDILDNYRGLYQIEQTFRISKYNLKIRPIFHYNPSRIKAHFAICYVALVLLRTLEFKTKQNNSYIPIEQLHELLLKVTTIKITNRDNKNFKITTNFPKELA